MIEAVARGLGVAPEELSTALAFEGAVIVPREPDEETLKRAAASAEKKGMPLSIWQVRAVWNALIGAEETVG